MSKKPNHYLSLLLNKKVTIILFLVFLALLIPTQPADALIGIDVFSFFSSALEGIEELSEVSTQFIQAMFLLFVVSSGFLMISAYLLQWVIVDFPIGLQNVLVQKGWTFTLSLANLSFIIIFVIIALSFILKRDTFQTKKTLINLVLVALLINFSLVMIGGMLDIAQIFYNTILGDGTNLVLDSISGLMGGVGGTIASLMGFILALLAAYSIPIIAPAAQVGTVALVFSTVFAPTIAHWILQISLNFIIGGIYFLYFFYFACRIFVIWFLAVLAPLAFISLILPQTKQYWKEWFDHLTEWIGVGLLLLFYLVLGIKLLPTALPLYPVQMSFFPFSFMGLGKAVFYYFGFIVYASVGLFLASRNLPKLVTSLSSTFGTIAKRVYSYAGKPIGQAYTAWIDQEQKTRKEEGKWGQLSGLGKVKRLTATIATGYPIARWALRVAGTSPKAIHTKNMENAEKRLEKQYGDDFKGLADGFGQLGPMGKAAAIHRLQEIGGEEALDELTPQQLKQGVKFAHQFSSDWVKDVVKHKPDFVKQGSEIFVQEAFNQYAKEIKEEDRDYKENYEELIKEGVAAEQAKQKAIAKTIFDRAVTDIRTSDIKDVDRTRLIGEENEDLRRAWLERFGPEYWNQIAMHFDQEVMDDFMKTANEMGAEELAKKNPRTFRYFSAIGQDRWGWSPIMDKDGKAITQKEKITEFIRGVREAEDKIKKSEMFSPQRMREQFLNLSKVEDSWLKGAKETLEKVASPKSLRQSINAAIRRGDPEDLVKLLEEQFDQAVKFESKSGLNIENNLKAIEAELTKRVAWKKTIEKPSLLPRITKEMPKELKTGIRRQRMYVVNIKKATERLKTIEKNINILEETGGDAQFIEDRKQELVNTQQSINQLKERLDEIKEEIKPMMEEEKARQKERAELEKTKKAYKELKKK